MNNLVFTVCNYNARMNGALDKALPRLALVKEEGTVIAFFDNGSKDGSVELLQDYYRSGLIDILIMQKKNMGKAYAMNRMYEIVRKTYGIAGDDILVNMDSDIQIMDRSFAKKVATAFRQGEIKYMGYQFFSDEAMTKKTINYYKSAGQLEIGGSRYDILANQHGLGGGILAMRFDHFAGVGGYSEKLGRGGSPAFYGGDDAVLIMKLFKAYPDEKALCCVDKAVVHPDTADPAY